MKENNYGNSVMSKDYQSPKKYSFICTFDKYRSPVCKPSQSISYYN